MASIKHTFRLQGPWKCRFYPLGNPAGLNFVDGEIFNGEEFKVTMPKSWQEIAGNFPGKMSLSRSFNVPPNLEENEYLSLSLEEINAEVSVYCHGELLIPKTENTPLLTFQLPQKLPASPRIDIEITTNEKTDWTRPIGLWKVVTLEIRN